EMGGIVKAVSNGMVQAEVSKQALAYEQKIQSGEMVKVGVNKYRTAEGSVSQEVELHEYKPEATEEQLARLAQVKAERDADAVNAALARVRDDAHARVNIMPAMMEAVRAYATVGEITGVLKEVFGEFQEPVRW
ncbi:MAG: methylmalonyl-CoA mutase, partial [Chloroflexi bacterium]